MVLIEQAARYIQGATGITCSYGALPQTPARCIAVFGSDVRTPRDTDGARIQVQIRGPDTGGAIPATDADAVAMLLDDFSGIFHPSGNYIVRVQLENGPTAIGADANNRQLYSLNFRVWYC